MSKKINRIIPKSMKPIGEKLSEIHARNLGIDEGSEDYEQVCKDYEYNFNDEAWGLSMTPSGLIGDSGKTSQNPINGHALFEQNPATPKVQAHYFDIMNKMFGKDGYVSNHVKNAYDTIKFERQIRGSIASLGHFFLESSYGSQIKSKHGETSDFEFRKDGGKANDKTVLSQYLRLYYTVQITKALEKVFLAPKINIEDIVADAFNEEVLVNPYASLNPKEMREEFVRFLYTGKRTINLQSEEKVETKNQGEYVGRLMSKKTNPNKNINDEVYYSHDEGLYFDKNKIDKFIEDNLNDCVQIVPKESYIMKKMASKEEILKASLNEPIVFGTLIKEGKNHNFLIIGEAQILKANNLGLPMIDCLILSPAMTIKMIRPTNKTLNKVNKIKKELITTGDFHGRN